MKDLNNKEIENIAPKLNELKGKAINELPKDYFQNLTDSILEDNQTETTTSVNYKWILSIAAGVALIIGSFFIYSNKGPSTELVAEELNEGDLYDYLIDNSSEDLFSMVHEEINNIEAISLTTVDNSEESSEEDAMNGDLYDFMLL